MLYGVRVKDKKKMRHTYSLHLDVKESYYEFLFSYSFCMIVSSHLMTEQPPWSPLGDSVCP
jgi:hypothetical protein